MQIEKIEERIRLAVDGFKMLENTKEVISALSGGADSMAMTHYLAKTGIKVRVAHVNHMLRGEEADRDEQCARDAAASLGLEFNVLKKDVKAEAARAKMGFEEFARRVRYEYFASLITDDDNTKIATAHTLSDSAETVIFNLTRGTGIRGLCGIPPRRMNIIRPLIFLTREEVENYCEHYNLEYIVDSTNLSEQYARNRIRLNVMPELKKINPSMEAATLRTAKIMAELDEFFTLRAMSYIKEAEIADTSFTYDISTLKELHNADLRYILATILRARCIVSQLDYGQINDLKLELIIKSLREGKGAVSLVGDLLIRIEQGKMFFETMMRKEK